MASKYFKIGQFIKNLAKGGKQKTTGTEVISSVPVSKNVKKYGVDYSRARTRLDASYQRGKRVDKNYKTMSDAKKAFKDAKKDLQKMVDTGQATKINKKVHRKGIKYESDDLYPSLKRNKSSKALFEASKGRKFNKGGRVGLKRGTFPDHSGDGQITKKDILMAKGVIPKPKGKKMAKSKSPMDKTVRKS